MATGRAPHSQYLTATPAGVGAAVTQSVILGESTEAGTLTEVSVLPASAVAANATNYRTWTVYNRGSTGAGTTVMATMDTSTTGLADNDERLMTLSVVPGATTVAADDVLEVVETVASGGVAHTGYRITATVASL